MDQHAGVAADDVDVVAEVVAAAVLVAAAADELVVAAVAAAAEVAAAVHAADGRFRAVADSCTIRALKQSAAP